MFSRQSKMAVTVRQALILRLDFAAAHQ